MAFWLRWIVQGAAVGALSVLACGTGVGCKKEASAAGFADRPPPLVNVATAVKQDVPLYLDEIGKASAFEAVTITPQIAGRVDSLHFTDGADIKKGQLLFTIDARPFTAALHQSEGQLAKDQAALANATSFLNRQADIFKQGFVSPSDYDTAQFNVKGSKAAVDADQASIEAAKLNVAYCSIVSPIDGRAGLRLVDPGNIVKLNETPLLVIQRLDPIYADFTINERELANVRSHMADHTLKTLVRLPTETGAGREGDLTFLDNAVQDASGTIKLRATLPNTDRHFWPGQFVNIRLVLSITPSILVPSSAPQTGQKGTYIFVVKNDMTAEMRPIVLGQRQGDLMVVEKGLSDGEKVITDGQLTVMPGGKVRVNPPTTMPATMPSVSMQLNSLSPVLRGEGRGEGPSVNDCGSCQPPDRPLTLTLSPEYRGAGTKLGTPGFGAAPVHVPGGPS